MAVYVDKAANNFGRMIMCHMIADTPDELHAMADKIGLRRAWFQKWASFPHYDLSKTRRAAALRAGAIELDRRELVNAMRRIRDAKTWEATPDGWAPADITGAAQ